MAYSFYNPVYSCADGTHELVPNGEGVYSDGRIRVEVCRQREAPGRERICCRWMNLTDKPILCQPEIRVRSDFRWTHYLIPGVSYNGNNWGRGKEPKGLMIEGKPWVFDYRRTTIPACTISECETEYLALFASDVDAWSLTASCAMEPQADGSMLHRLLYPEIEKPKTYCTRDGYSKAHEDYVLLQAGSVFSTTAFILSGRPRAKNFAAADVEDAALDLLGKPFEPVYTAQEVEQLSCSFARRLVTCFNGRQLLSIGQLPNERGLFENRPGFAFGWCGQNGMYARLMLQYGMEQGDDELIRISESVLDAFSHEAVTKLGLIHTNYDWMINGRSDVEDTCNLGFAVLELTRAWQLARQHGKERRKWLDSAQSTADFMIAHWSDEYGFGKAWNVENGQCIDPQGTIGAYLIPGLTALYHATCDETYLNAAKRACRFYRDRDLARFECTAGALDTYCIDKESSGPMLAGSLALFDIDGDLEWLDCAQKAAWYFCSWMFHHDTINLADSDFARYGFRTLGGTSVSAQHHHIDPWGALVVPQLMHLWEITGDEHWKKRALLMWTNAIQNIAPKDGKVIHNHFRGAGAQNEGYHHCHWGEEGAPGFINDWLVAWPQAFCWNAAASMRAIGK